jgi:hypothetical protein
VLKSGFLYPPHRFDEEAASAIVGCASG